MRFASKSAIFFLALSPLLRGDGLIQPLDTKHAEQARKMLADFKTNPKGPYFQIRWYCKDGSVFPPAGTPCRAHGGGIQYAESSPAAKTLAQWNLDVGTILASLDFPKFLDARRDHWLPRELVLEKYLTEVDQGWIYRKGGSYRGARQVEDEEKAGRLLLTQMLGDPDWVRRNYFLVNQLVAAIPHGIPDSSVLKSRTLAGSIAERDHAFQNIRAKIHSQPGPEDLAAVEQFISERKSDDPQLRELADLLRQEYGTAAEIRLTAFQTKLAGTPVAARLNDYVGAMKGAKGPAAGAALTLEILRHVTSAGGDAKTKLTMLDLNALVLEQAFRAGQKLPDPAQRKQQLAALLEYMRYATGAGLLSQRELDSLQADIDSIVRDHEVAPTRYLQAIRYLERSAGWCRATVARDFGPVSRHYQPAEPLAAGLVDHLLRGSVGLQLTARLEVLVADANRAAGIRHSIFGAPDSRGIVAMNPGVAIGRLGIIEGVDDQQTVDPSKIYIIPQTLSDLEPMAGILTLDSGNALSHSQLLAANLGIPNATVPSALLPMLREHRDQELFFAVTRGGVVVLREKSSLAPDEIKLWADKAATNKVRVSLSDKARLSDTRLIPLTELTAADVGVKAGPKAANLGQLTHFFPENVAPGLVVPFGIYYEHIHRSIGGGPPLDEQIAKVYGHAEQMRDSGAPTAEVNRYIYPELARIRKIIQTMPLLPAFEKELKARMAETFGLDGSYGVFVRSDTNAEDLPEFTGAGLNLTVPNQIGFKNVTQSLKDVWASPFEERAWDWRSRILTSSAKVYPSVLLLRSVPSDKSGVIATVNLETGEDDITVNVSEGVSAVVDGGIAESLLLRPDGTVRLLEQARGTYRKALKASGDFENVPVIGGDFLLQPDEIRQLRAMVADVKKKYPPAYTARGDVLPWDIEFGFVKGQLRLFQIRPLARYQEQRTLAALSSLDKGANPVKAVKLDERP